MAHKDPDTLVIAARPGTLGEADLLKAALAAEGIGSFIEGAQAANMMPGLTPAIHVRVLVAAKDLPRAEALLGQLAGRRAAKPLPPSTPDILAHSAWRCWLYSFIAPFMWPFAIYYTLKARAVARRQPPTDPPTYARNIRRATIALAVLVLLIFIALLRNAEDLSRKIAEVFGPIRRGL